MIGSIFVGILGVQKCALPIFLLFFFFFNDTATTEIYTLSLHDALPIYENRMVGHYWLRDPALAPEGLGQEVTTVLDDIEAIVKKVHAGTIQPARSEEHTSELQSRETISYAVFCLKKKKKNKRAKQ